MTHEAPTIDLTPSAQKYAVGLLSLAVTLITALSAAAAGPWTLTVILGVVIVGVQGVVGYIVPLLPGGWAGGLKTGLAVVLAALTAVLPLLTGTVWTFANTLVVILAGVNALAVQLGVAIRSDATAKIDAGTVQVGKAAIVTSLSGSVNPATTSAVSVSGVASTLDPTIAEYQESVARANGSIDHGSNA